MSQQTRLHFVTGKGGVGRSTVAAALARALAERKEGPVLLVDVQGSGHSLRLVGLEGSPYKNTLSPWVPNLWAARILPKQTFRQYFNLLLALGKEESSIALATANVRARIVDLVLENKIVSAFVDVCPGLEPAVLLGKIHWEVESGHTPEDSSRWRHVVVDAPATGHLVMLFRSTRALVEVFGSGVIFKQANEIMRLMKDPGRCEISVVSTPEELPLQETRDLSRQLQDMGLATKRFFLNRVPPSLAPSVQAIALSPDWAREVELERESIREQRNLLDAFRAELGKASCLEIPEISTSEAPAMLAEVMNALRKGGLA